MENILDTTEPYIKLTAKKEYVTANGIIKSSILPGQTIFLSNYWRHQNNNQWAKAYPFIIGDELPEDKMWKDNPTFGWIGKEEVLEYFKQ